MTTECPICNIDYDDKRHIPYDACREGHTICKICLDDIKNSANKKCPICRNQIDQRVNRFALNIIHENKQRSAARGIVWPQAPKQPNPNILNVPLPLPIVIKRITIQDINLSSNQMEQHNLPPMNRAVDPSAGNPENKCCSLSFLWNRNFWMAVLVVILIIYHWVTEALAWYVALQTSVWFILFFLMFLAIQYYMMYGVFKDARNVNNCIETMRNQLFLWRWDLFIRDGLPKVFITRTGVVIFCLIGLITVENGWSIPVNIVTLVFNCLAGLDVLLVMHVVRQKVTDNYQRILSNECGQRFMLVIMIILTIYSYAEPILQIIYLARVCPIYLIVYYSCMYVCSTIVIILDSGWSRVSLQKFGISIVGYPFVPTLITMISFSFATKFKWIFAGIVIFMKFVVGPIMMLAYICVQVKDHSLGVGALIMTMLSFAQVEIGLLFYNKL